MARWPWIAGGGTGIGLAGAVELAIGARIVLSGRDENRLRSACDEVARAGGQAEALALDVGDAASISRAASQIVEVQGRIDILINSAGLNAKNCQWSNITSDAWDSVIGAARRADHKHLVMGREIREPHDRPRLLDRQGIASAPV